MDSVRIKIYKVTLMLGIHARVKSNLVNTFPTRVKRGVIYSQISSSIFTKIVHSVLIQTGRNPMSNSTLH